VIRKQEIDTTEERYLYKYREKDVNCDSEECFYPELRHILHRNALGVQFKELRFLAVRDNFFFVEQYLTPCGNDFLFVE
jgi:hypothetical protein